MSATAVSNAIAGLESRLEARLFNRTTRSVALTDAGQRYVARIGPALQEIRLASEEIHSDTGEPAGTLRLNVPNHIGTLFLDQLLIDFMIRYPKMRVETVSEARMIDIVAEGYDAGIRLEESVPQDMIAVPPRFATPDLFASIRAVKAGLGVGFLPELYIREELENGELVSVLNDWALPFAGLRLYYPGHRHVPPGLRALVAMIRERGIIPG